MTAVLSTLANESSGGFFCTCVIVRPFHATTDLHRQYEHEVTDFWTERIRRRQEEHLADPDSDTYWVTVDAIEDDPFVRMCEYADYGLFYVGHTAGDPAPPRLATSSWSRSETGSWRTLGTASGATSS